jgi:hypothetical protein
MRLGGQVHASQQYETFYVFEVLSPNTFVLFQSYNKILKKYFVHYNIYLYLILKKLQIVI